MTTIKCPICKERLSGEGDGLSVVLREHMASVHEMSELVSTHRVGALHVPPSDYSSEDTMSLREAEGPVRESWREEMKMWTSPPVPAKESGEDRREASLHKEGAQVMPPAPLYEPETSGPLLRVECPLCDALITAPLEEDLSDDLRDHMADRHDIREKRMAWVAGRR